MMGLHADDLLSAGPIVAVLMRAEVTRDGWELWVRHRHFSGLFSDCQHEEYSRLTLGELQDVLESIASGWAEVRPPPVAIVRRSP